MKRQRFFVLIVACLLVFATSAVTQEKPPQFVEVMTVHVKASGIEAFEYSVKKFVEAFDKAGADLYWGGANVLSGGTHQTYLFAFPFNRWGEMDAWPESVEVLTKALGEDEAEKVMKAWSSSIESSDSAIYVLLDDMITHSDKPADTEAKYYTVTRTEVNPGMQDSYELYIKKYIAAEEQDTATKKAVRRVSVFGPASVYVTSRAWKQLGEADALPSGLLQKAYGEEEARAIAVGIASCIKERVSWLLQYRSELSRPPKSPATN